MASRALRRSLYAFLLIILFGACSPGAKRKELIVYSAHGNDILFQFKRAFEQEHPDVDVATVYRGAQELVESIRLERKNPQAAIWWGSDSTSMDAAAKEGLLLAYTPTYATPDLPRHAHNFWTGCFQLPVVVGYHPGRIATADLPKRFADLADPKFRGKILLREPAPSGTLRTFIGSMLARSIAETGDETQGFAMLRGIHQNILHYEGSAELLWEALEAGPGALTIWNLTDLIFQNREKGFHFRAAGLDEPVPVIIDAIALVDSPGGRTPEARAFYEFVNTLDAMKILARQHGRIPARPDFDKALLLDDIRAVTVTPMEVDRALINEKTPAWMSRFETDVRGRR